MQKKYKFKSRFEQQTALLLSRLGVQFDYELMTVPYTLEHEYVPDFPVSNGLFFIETKGLFDSNDRRKHLAIKKQHPNLDIRFIFQRDNKLSKKSNTRYSDWCEKHGFKYSIGLGIPEEWLEDIDKFLTKETKHGKRFILNKKSVKKKKNT